jgi:glycosyltransferase involved in cell wall biosynthesis
MVESKRIVILIDRYLPILGGAQNNIHQLGKMVVKNGDHVTVITRMVLPELLEQEEIEGILVKRSGKTRHRILNKGLAIIQNTLHLIRTRKQYDGMVCVLAAYYTELLPAYLSSFFTGKPYLVRTTMTNTLDHLLSYIPDSLPDLIKKITVPPFIWRKALNRAEGIIIQSPLLLEKAYDYKVAKPIYIPSGVDTQRFRKVSEEEKCLLRSKLGLCLENVIITYTARYISGKNQITLLKAVEKIHKEIRPGKVTLVLIGATEFKDASSNEQELRDYVRKQNLEEVVLFVNNALRVEDYLGASDIFVLPTLDEAMSNSALEAMAAGLPIIASNIPQVTHMFPEDWKYFFEPLDVEELVLKLIELTDSEDLRAKNGRRLEDYVRDNFRLEKIAERYLKVIEGMVNGSSNRED